jgi:hypothetical protein
LTRSPALATATTGVAAAVGTGAATLTAGAAAATLAEAGAPVFAAAVSVAGLFWPHAASATTITSGKNLLGFMIFLSKSE